MREVGPGPDVWWRADDPPAPRPVLQGATRNSRRRRLGAWVLGAGVLLLLGNPELRAAALAQVERGVELAGLGLQQVTLTGHRFTADSDIYAALGLDGARTLLSFDADAAKARIEQLPWIERASIERVAPHGIDVHVTERVPFAVWRLGDRNWIIDRSGRKLQVVPADVMPQLPRVAGAGAGKEAAALSALLAGYPAIARKVEVAERVSRRRWRLHVGGGGIVDLPAREQTQALTQLTRLLELGVGDAKRIDLRASDRILIEGLDRASRTAARGSAAPAGT